MLKPLLGKFLMAAAVVVAGAAVAQAEKRVALVIGNSDYEATGRLPNPERDALAMSRKLGGLGFDVIEGYNLTYDELRETVRQFAKETRGADLSVFFYAGHGIAVDQVNYIVPVDAQMNDPIDWEFEVYALPDILRSVSRAESASLVFLDACRDNPMASQLAELRGMSTRTLNQSGLSLVNPLALPTSGSVVAYATEPGDVAFDGDGENSPFTAALLRHIGTANTDFAVLTSLITRDVLEMTGGSQRPRFDVSLTGPLVLNRVETVVSQAPSVAPSLDVEKIIFNTARDTGDIADYQAYLDSFPNGVFAVVARNAIARLKREAGVAEPGSQAGRVAVAEPELASATRIYRSSDPLVLPMTQAAIGLAANKTTEDELALTRMQRKELQLRLNLAGQKAGRPDGIVGKGTRRGIRGWQRAVGFEVTGYMNAVQYQMLVAKTETAFAQHMSSNPDALTKVSTKSRKSTGTTKKRKTNTTQKVAKPQAPAPAPKKKTFTESLAGIEDRVRDAAKDAFDKD